MNSICPICSKSEFKEFRGRENAQCVFCKSLERHRFAFLTYQKYVLPTIDLASHSCVTSILHLAPEKFFYDKFSTLSRYLACDANPERYSFGKVERLQLPADFEKIEGMQFDFILHNHVLEHIPGHWFDHINSFVKALKVNGKMIFTIPATSMNPTREGGEYLASDDMRRKLFGQDDHYRKFGFDFILMLKKMKNLDIELSYPTESDICSHSLGVLKDPVYIIERIT